MSLESPTVVISCSPSFEAVAANALAAFPSTDVVKRVDVERGETLQFGVGYDTIRVIFDAVILHPLLGLAYTAAAGAAWTAGKKLVELMTVDGYEWVKYLLKEALAKRHAWDVKSPRDATTGVRVHLNSADDEVFGCIFYLIASANRAIQSPKEMEDSLALYRSVVRPAIAAVAKTHAVTGCTRPMALHGRGTWWLGPSRSDAGCARFSSIPGDTPRRQR